MFSRPALSAPALQRLAHLGFLIERKMKKFDKQWAFKYD
jgi:hypothetical protein